MRYYFLCLQLTEPWLTALKRILISLSRTGALYANNQLLAKNCTSFLVTQAHILFTTSQHLLKFVHLTKAEGLLSITISSPIPSG